MDSAFEYFEERLAFLSADLKTCGALGEIIVQIDPDLFRHFYGNTPGARYPTIGITVRPRGENNVEVS